MFLRLKPSEQELRDFLTRQTQSRFSYPMIGLSATESVPPGYVLDRNRILLGYGQDIWNKAVSAIDRWEMFNIEWLHLCWPDVPIVEGNNVLVLIRHFGFWSVNAARIVYTIKESSASVRRYGFAYGTLLEHSETGEERFSVEWHSQDNAIWYDLFAFSFPQKFLAIVGYPLARRLQRRFRDDSAIAMAKACSAA
jgi:uncharacterized protein (UPF0548 family)